MVHSCEKQVKVTVTTIDDAVHDGCIYCKCTGMAYFSAGNGGWLNFEPPCVKSIEGIDGGIF